MLKLGHNYGWPVIFYGIDYDGKPITNLTDKDGMDQPVKYWKPSPALSALEFYRGDLFPKWKHQAFVGALGTVTVKGQEVVRWTQPADWQSNYDTASRKIAPGTIAFQSHDLYSVTAYANIQAAAVTARAIARRPLLVKLANEGRGFHGDAA